MNRSKRLLKYTAVFKSMDNDAVKKFDEYINGM